MDTRISAEWVDGSNGDSDCASYTRGGECSNRWDGSTLNGEGKPCAACLHKGKEITSFVAIVASNTGDFGQGRVRWSNTGTPRSHTFFLFTPLRFRYTACLTAFNLSMSYADQSR
jgi:hypothetical protein